MNAPAFTPQTALGRATLALLWARTAQRGDMPGFAKAIGAILGAMRGEDDSDFNMTHTVLSDPVLTQKVLRLANSSMYGAFGQSINTVSKAVLVLGTDAIGHLALGLKLIEELSSATPDSVSAHIEMEKALLAGMVAQQVAGSAASAHAEEAVVGSMLHTLGRMMLAFYMNDYWSRLQAQAGAGNEAAAAPAMLGLTLEQVGQAAAERWGLPSHLVQAMRTLEPPEPGAEVSRADWMAGLCTLSSRCAESLWHDDAAGAARVGELVGRYAGMLGVEADGLAAAVGKARAIAAADLSIAPLSQPAERREAAQTTDLLRAAGNRTLVSGLADMRGALDTASPGQMVSMALETIYKSFHCARAVAFARNHKERRYGARMTLGDGVRAALPLMEFGEADEANVFHAAMNSGRVIFIEHAREPKFAAMLPQWWKNTLPGARSFVILPLSANGLPTGFIYGDWDDKSPAAHLNQTEFNLLNDMRALLIKSIELRQQQALAAGKIA